MTQPKESSASKGASDGAKARALTDSGNAERLVEAYGDELRFCHAWAKWFCWDARRWHLDDSGHPMQLSKIVARRIRIEAMAATEPDLGEQLAKWTKASESRGKRQAMVELAKYEPGIAIQLDELDLDPWLLNCMNGTLDLRTGKLRAHDRADNLTKLVPHHYDPAAGCPLWLAFLERILPNPEVRAFVQRAVGWSLTADVSAQVFFFCYGLGANGKSTFLNVLQKMLGTDFAIQAAPELLLARRERSHPTDQADLFRIRLAVCTEIGAGRSLDEVTVKQLTGGDKIRARRMREDFWEFSPTHHIWIAANHKPIVRGTDEAIWRRILLVPFEVTIPEAERDPKLLDSLAAEMPGILAWAVGGCEQWLQQGGLHPPDAVLLATKEYQDEMDVVGGFVGECCKVHQGASTPASVLYAAYQAWAAANSEEPVNQKTFGVRLTERGHQRKKRRGVYHYVNLLLEHPAPEPDGDDGGRSGPSFGIAPGERAAEADAGTSSPSSPDAALAVLPRGDEGGRWGPSSHMSPASVATGPHSGTRSPSSPIVPPDDADGLHQQAIDGDWCDPSASLPAAGRADEVNPGDVCCAAIPPEQRR